EGDDARALQHPRPPGRLVWRPRRRLGTHHLHQPRDPQVAVPRGHGAQEVRGRDHEPARAPSIPRRRAVDGRLPEVTQPRNYLEEGVAGGVPLKMWTRGGPIEDEAKRQLANAARLPIVFRHIAAMPDVHFGIGATVGSVIPTVKAIIPAAVGV